ncbi:uncharacterized protein LOC143284202 [Babylonia areolata]|uniref:uncharacterized protein LOC143284202 n=1 Tax=Babylonia areolata TaxID=304850 RepID=UPI003FD5AAEA
MHRPVDRQFYNISSNSANKSHFRAPSSSDRETLVTNVANSIIGRDKTFCGPFGQRQVVYLDYIASGRALSFIEDYIQKEVLPEYGNTHTTTSVTSLQTTLFRHEARDIIRNAVNASEHDSVIFTGSGTTGAVHKLIHALNLKDPPVVLVGPFEHHSNLLPWKEVSAQVVTIQRTVQGTVDLCDLENKLKVWSETGRQLIGSFSAASNVTGVLCDVDAVTVMLHRYSALAFWDYATAAPYLRLDMNPVVPGKDSALVYKDAMFFSPHKFVGGINTPGVLVAKKRLFQSDTPHVCGGGTVFYVRRDAHRYLREPELREEGGTPDIVGAIRAGLVLQLKTSITPELIMLKERSLFRRAVEAWRSVPNLVMLGDVEEGGGEEGGGERLPIFSFLLHHPHSSLFLHHNFVSAVLNDLFGIQARGGCACAGPFAMDLLGLTEEKAAILEDLLAEDSRLDRVHLRRYMEYSHREILRPGFTRLNLPYFMGEDQVDFVLQAVALMAEHAWKLLPQYMFNPETGEWRHREQQVFKERKWLGHISYASGCMEYSAPKVTPKAPLPQSFQECLNTAKQLFNKAEKTKTKLADQTLLFDEEARPYRWFLLPSEAAQVLLGTHPLLPRSVTSLPFCPHTLSRQLSSITKETSSAAATQGGETEGDFRASAESGDSCRFCASAESGDICHFCASAENGDDCRFQGSAKSGDSCRFCASAESGDDCRFQGSAKSGDSCRFCASAESGDGCRFQGSAKSGDDCRFQGSAKSGDSCRFCASAESGDGCRFQGSAESGDGCRFQGSAKSGDGCRFQGSAESGDGCRFQGSAESGDDCRFQGSAESGDDCRFQGSAESTERGADEKGDSCEKDHSTGQTNESGQFGQCPSGPDTQRTKGRPEEETDFSKAVQNAMERGYGGKVSVNTGYSGKVSCGNTAPSLNKGSQLVNDSMPESVVFEDISLSCSHFHNNHRVPSQESGGESTAMVVSLPDVCGDVCDRREETDVCDLASSTKSEKGAVAARTDCQKGDVTAEVCEPGDVTAEGCSASRDTAPDCTRSSHDTKAQCGVDNTVPQADKAQCGVENTVPQTDLDQSGAAASGPSPDSSSTRPKSKKKKKNKGKSGSVGQCAENSTCDMQTPGVKLSRKGAESGKKGAESGNHWVSPSKDIFKPAVKALEEFGMVSDGDRVLVCLSGGKDSLSLLHTMHQYQFYCCGKGIQFDLGAVTVDPQTPSYDPSPLKQVLADLGVPYFYESQCIMETAVNLPYECASICSFCSRMKRGRIYAAARREGYNVLALGQHLDDLAESFMMSLFHNGSLRTMKAHYTVQGGDLRVIRPFVYVREKDLRNFAEKNGLPVIAENCPACFEAPKERHRTKQLLASQEVLFPRLYSSILSAIKPVMSISRTGCSAASLLSGTGAEDDLDI